MRARKHEILTWLHQVMEVLSRQIEKRNKYESNNLNHVVGTPWFESEIIQLSARLLQFSYRLTSLKRTKISSSHSPFSCKPSFTLSWWQWCKILLGLLNICSINTWQWHWEKRQVFMGSCQVTCLTCHVCNQWNESHHVRNDRMPIHQ